VPSTPRIDWTREIERIERAAARAPRRCRRRRVTLPPAIVAAIKRQADREYAAWFADLAATVERLLSVSPRSQTSRRSLVFRGKTG
jgi:hypothetical protein